MSIWNEFFSEPRNIKRAPEAEIYHFTQTLVSAFPGQTLRIWDLCCGAGRHTVALAQLGYQVFASDHASKALRLTQTWLIDLGLSAHVVESDMTVCPWPEVLFHGVMSWDALNHNTLDNIRQTICMVHDQLVPGGLFLLTLKSTRAGLYGQGELIEPNTYISKDGSEAGIPHHYSDEEEVREFFQGWEIISLADQVIRYVEQGRTFAEHNPFPHTTWGILARKGF